MAGLFEATGGGDAAIVLDEVEISILRSFAVQMVELIGPGPGGDAETEGADPLRALFAEGPTAPPEDPALARLFPDAYSRPGEKPDEEQRTASAEFRRYTEIDLRARKRDDALTVVRTLDGLASSGERGGVLRLDAQQCRRWLGALNDLRLTLGSRLGIVRDDDDGRLYNLPDDDPRKPLVMAYLWLGAMQESLIEAISS